MEKIEIRLTIADYWFKADDATNSEKYINQAAHEMHLIDPKYEDGGRMVNDKYTKEEKVKAMTLKVSF